MKRKKFLISMGSVALVMALVIAVRPADAGTVAAVDLSGNALRDGDLISANASDGDPDIFIVKLLVGNPDLRAADVNGYKRLFLNPAIFSMYGHLGGFSRVRQVSASVRDSFATAVFFRNCETGDQRVWGVEVTGEDEGVLHHVQIGGDAAVSEDRFFFSKVFCINTREDNFYVKSTLPYLRLRDVPQYVRRTPSPTGTVQVSPGATPEPTATSVPSATGSPVIGGCQIFPSDNAWNTDISAHAVHPNSAAYINSMGTSTTIHPDFGGGGAYGIPFDIVESSQEKVPVTFTAYGAESDPGPYPIPSNARIEGGSDAHVLVMQKGTCMLYELFAAAKTTSGWSGDSGAVWNLRSNALRPLGWTSADAAGLPIMPGLVKYDEAHSGTINHAIRFTASSTQRGYIFPATHFAGSVNAALPPMGLRVRLKAGYDISRLTGEALAIARAMKKYGLILADNGSNWYITGAMDTRWDDDNLNQLKSIPGSAFEAVSTGEIHY